MKKSLFILICLTSTLFANGQEFRKYANNFLYNGVDSRGRAMGNAIAASSEDVFASYWNPAGLVDSDLTRNQFGFMHVFDGLYNYDVLGFALPTKKQDVIGFSAIRYGVDDIPNTIFLVDDSGNINYDNVRTFNAADYAFLMTYASELNNRFSLGGSAKIIHRNVGDFANAWGGGLDVGLKYKSINDKFRAAAFAKDIFGTYSSWNFKFNDPEIVAVFLNTGNELPEDGSIEATSPTLVLGGNYLWDLGKFSIAPELDMDITFDGKRNTFVSSDFLSIDPYFGLEMGYEHSVYLRGGINNIQQISSIDSGSKWDLQANAGAGVQLPGIGIDYALTQFDYRDELTHLITIKVGIAKKKKFTDSSNQKEITQ